jgi:D-tyrosyl-tRNA(Tyr) deacylase
MRAVVQRVSRAAVRVEGRTVGAIERGVVILLGVATGDGEDAARVLAAKSAKLRIFPSESKPIDRSLVDCGGAALVVSQFTLCADMSKGNRPSFIGAAEPKTAEALYRAFCEHLRAARVPVATGVFGAAMEVELVNDGPVTIVLDTAERAEAPSSVQDRIRALVPAYLEQRQAELVQLAAALASGDLATAQRIGHNLKGTGASYGFPVLSELGLELERAARVGDAAGAGAAVERLAACVERLARELSTR